MSSRVMKTVLAAAAVSFGAAAAPATASAVAAEAVVPAVKTPEPERANQMRAEAEAFFSSPRHWRRAARLLERSADLRAAEDAETYMSLLLAGNLRAAMNDYNAAQANFERAAAHAGSRGAVLDQAHAYISAAHAAVQGGYGEQAIALVERARLLTESPQLSADEKDQITRRITAGAK